MPTRSPSSVKEQSLFALSAPNHIPCTFGKLLAVFQTCLPFQVPMALNSLSYFWNTLLPYPLLVLVENCYSLLQLRLKHLFLCKAFPDPATIIKTIIFGVTTISRTYTSYSINLTELKLFILKLPPLSDNGPLSGQRLTSAFHFYSQPIAYQSTHNSIRTELEVSDCTISPSLQQSINKRKTDRDLH